MPQNHLEILKPRANFAGPSSFTQFPSLPAEIRVSIWTWALRHQRIIRIFLRSHAKLCSRRAWFGTHFPLLEPGEDDPSYYPVVTGRRLLSKLLRVNAESREVTLSFQRVHLRCWLTDKVTKFSIPSWTSGRIYINPEYDFLRIEQDTMAIVDFVCGLKTKHDPRNVGIRNLALCENQLGGRMYGLDAIEPSEIESSKMRLFKEIISGLDEVWLVYIQTCIQEQTGIEGIRETIRKTFFERSFPITATPHRFDRIGLDPRTVENDLGHLNVRIPERFYDSWLQVLERIGVRPREERYRILIAGNPRRTICILGDAEDWLQSEDSGCATKPESTWSSQEPNAEGATASETSESRVEDISKAVRPAFGFWLFPVNAFCDANKTSGPRNYMKTFDVRKHRPELVLRRLNEGDTDRNVSEEVASHHESPSNCDTQTTNTIKYSGATNTTI